MLSDFPKAAASSSNDLIGPVSVAVQQVAALSAQTSPLTFGAMALVGLDPPESRGSLRLGQMASSIATIFNNCGPKHCTLAAFMAAQPKDKSQEDLVEHEVRIMPVVRAGERLHIGAHANWHGRRDMEKSVRGERYGRGAQDVLHQVVRALRHHSG